jgi:hypothetical protein
MTKNYTKSTIRGADSNRFMSRTKVYIPFYGPNAVAASWGITGTATTTVQLTAFNSTVKFRNVSDTAGTVTNRLIGAKMTTNADSVFLNWKTPDNFYEGDPTHVWLIWAKLASTTTNVMSYDVLYSAAKIIDVVTSSADMVNAEAPSAPTTAMDTDLDEAVTLTKTAKRYGLFRSMRGVINGGKLEVGDIVTFKARLDAAPTNSGKMSFLGLEIDYAIRLRDGEQIEQYL